MPLTVLCVTSKDNTIIMKSKIKKPGFYALCFLSAISPLRLHRLQGVTGKDTSVKTQGCQCLCHKLYNILQLTKPILKCS